MQRRLIWVPLDATPLTGMASFKRKPRSITYPLDAAVAAVAAVAVVTPVDHNNAKRLNYPRDQAAVLMMSAAQVHARANQGTKLVSDRSLRSKTR